jgi:hypothetical protein
VFFFLCVFRVEKPLALMEEGVVVEDEAWKSDLKCQFACVFVCASVGGEISGAVSKPVNTRIKIGAHFFLRRQQSNRYPLLIPRSAITLLASFQVVCRSACR